jgi:hypothetical protein
VHLPSAVESVTLDMRRTVFAEHALRSDGLAPNQMSISGLDGVQRLKLRMSNVESKTVSILQRIADWPGSMKLDLHLDIFSMSVGAMQRVVKCIATGGKANTLETLWLGEGSSGQRCGEFPKCLPSVLSVCRGLVSLRVELPSATGLCAILTSVGRDLVNLKHFHLGVREASNVIEDQTIAPCMLLDPEHHRVLRFVVLDFLGIDLADRAVALLVDAAVQRCVNHPRNVHILKVEGSSIGVHALTALTASTTALPGCKFHFYDSFEQKPVSPLVYAHQTLCYPFVDAPCVFD